MFRNIELVIKGNLYSILLLIHPKADCQSSIKLSTIWSIAVYLVHKIGQYNLHNSIWFWIQYCEPPQRRITAKCPALPSQNFMRSSPEENWSIRGLWNDGSKIRSQYFTMDHRFIVKLWLFPRQRINKLGDVRGFLYKTCDPKWTLRYRAHKK